LSEHIFVSLASPAYQLRDYVKIEKIIKNKNNIGVLGVTEHFLLYNFPGFPTRRVIFHELFI